MLQLNPITPPDKFFEAQCLLGRAFQKNKTNHQSLKVILQIVINLKPKLKWIKQPTVCNTNLTIVELKPQRGKCFPEVKIIKSV